MNLLGRIKRRDAVKQINKAVCDDCQWTYLARAGEDESIAEARGRVHKHQFGHRVHLLQDIVDLYLKEIGKEQTR